MPFKEKLTIGSRVLWDGETYEVTAFIGAIVELRSNKGQSARVEVRSLLASPDFRLLDLPENAEPAVTFPDNVSQDLLDKAEELLAHLHEAETGYRSGDASMARQGEPLAQYDPALTTLVQRMKTKAIELNVTLRTLWNLKKQYETFGLIGLIDKRHLREAATFQSIDPRIKQAVCKVLDDLTNKSNVSRRRVRRLVARHLKAEHKEEIKLPSEHTFNRLLNELSRGRNTFGSAKGRRSIANRPPTPYHHPEPTRPGEVVLIDSTPLDAYAIDPVSFKWVQVQLTIAFDLKTRSIVGWRFTPAAPKAVDAALLLYDVIHPKPMRPGWPSTARWPYVGVPEHVVIEIAGSDDLEQGVAGIPFVYPEEVWVDHGRIFISRAFKDACNRLGINLQMARPYTPTDKSHIERVFRSIREMFVENLPGYKGPDIFSRGADVESDAFFFLDEIEDMFAEWVATCWQPRPHDGLRSSALPSLILSPNQMYEEGIARAGFVYVVPDPCLYYELLPTYWRTIQHYGVEIDGLVYDGDILEDFRNQTSSKKGENAGKWPIRVDGRNRAQVFFHDYTLNQWHELYWIGAKDPNRPFNDAVLRHAKTVVLNAGGDPRNQFDLESALNALLDKMDNYVFANRKERRLEAIRRMQAEQAAKDRPLNDDGWLLAPDEEFRPRVLNRALFDPPNGPDRVSTADFDDMQIKILRTVDESMDEDDLL